MSRTIAYEKIQIYSSLPVDMPKDVAKVFLEYYLSEFFRNRSFHLYRGFITYDMLKA